MQVLSKSQIDEINGGGNVAVNCSVAGFLFGAVVGTGNVFGAAAMGFYLGANCFN